MWCKTQAQCASLDPSPQSQYVSSTLTRRWNNTGSWKADHDGMSSCDWCGPRSLHGCNPVDCLNVDLNNSGMASTASEPRTLVFHMRENRCGICSRSDYRMCNTQSLCEALNTAALTAQRTWYTWNAYDQECRMCSGCDSSGCDTAEKCSAIEADCPSYGADASPVLRTVFKSMPNGRYMCSACGNATLTRNADMCVVTDTRWQFNGCQKNDCESYGGKWNKKDGRCGMCSVDQPWACLTEASCVGSEGLKFDKTAPGRGGTKLAVSDRRGERADWDSKKKQCSKCSKDDVWGCKTKDACDWVKPLAEADSYYPVKVHYECGECRKCGEGSYHSCKTRGDCLNNKIEADEKLATVSWLPSKKECRACHVHDTSGCVTKATCEALTSHPRNDKGVKFTWKTETSKCEKCGDGDLDGCTSQADCEAAVAHDASATVTFNATLQRCMVCSMDRSDGCFTKATCEAQQDEGGISFVWHSKGFCMRGCSRDNVFACTTKALCDAVSANYPEVEWQNTSSYAVCKKCEHRKGPDGTCIEKCLTTQEMAQDHCGANAENYADCNATCSFPNDAVAAMCKEMYGLNADGTFVTLGPDGLPMNETTQAAVNAKTTVTETTFDMDVAVPNAAAFKEDGYLKELAKATGVPASDITVESKTFVIEVAYEFTGDTITEAKAKTAIASDWGVDESNLTVTLTVVSATARRLESSSRRLSGTKTQVTAELKTTNATAADGVMTKAATPAGVVSNLAAAGVTATATVTDAPSMTVKVKTKVLSKGNIAQPNPGQLQKIAEESGGTGAVLDKSSWTTEEVADTRPSKATASFATRFVPRSTLAALLALTWSFMMA